MKKVSNINQIVYINGHSATKNRQGGNTLADTLAALSKTEMTDRMEKSVGSCDHIARAAAISKGKASQVRMITPTSTIEFWSCDNVKDITGYTWPQIRYRITDHNGLLVNGNTVQYIKRYTANDKVRGTKRSKNKGS